ncbi:MAG TPA: hypothetical protein VFF73_14475 [Planctomycetota bacterium]|nr:hypothetical protein [Planctomycetota bacterium]
MSLAYEIRKRWAIACYEWAKPHVKTCPECAWRWYGILGAYLHPADLAQVELELPAIAAAE